VYERDPARCVVLLPGAQYAVTWPLLWFAREAATEQGWSVLAVRDEHRGGEPFAWACDRAERALAATGAERVAVVGKSLASGAAGLAGDRGLPAVWLTPLLDSADVVDGLARTRAPTVLVGSADDRTWDAAAIPDNPALEIVELQGVDHSLQRKGDVQGSLDALRRVTQAVAAFLGRLA
jgi:hypothetical protein